MELLSCLAGISFLIFLVVVTVKSSIKVVKEIIEYFKNREYIDYDARSLFEYLICLIFFIFLIYMMDRYNLFSKLALNTNITKTYDWLAFLGAVISSITGALVLIFVTRMDRKENNRIVCNAQRPYLSVEFKDIESRLIDNTKEYAYSFPHLFEDGETIIPFITIMNAGETVAIIETSESCVRIKYGCIEKIEKGEPQTMLKEKVICLNDIVERLVIPSNKTAYVFFNAKDFDIPMLINSIEVEECIIFYRDLFGNSYEDKSMTRNGKLCVEKDNSKNDDLY